MTRGDGERPDLLGPLNAIGATGASVPEAAAAREAMRAAAVQVCVGCGHTALDHHKLDHAFPCSTDGCSCKDFLTTAAHELDVRAQRQALADDLARLEGEDAATFHARRAMHVLDGVQTLPWDDARLTPCVLEALAHAATATALALIARPAGPVDVLPTEILYRLAGAPHTAPSELPAGVANGDLAKHLTDVLEDAAREGTNATSALAAGLQTWFRTVAA